jgi:hypothetical protein
MNDCTCALVARAHRLAIEIDLVVQVNRSETRSSRGLSHVERPTQLEFHPDFVDGFDAINTDSVRVVFDLSATTRAKAPHSAVAGLVVLGVSDLGDGGVANLSRCDATRGTQF